MTMVDLATLCRIVYLTRISDLVYYLLRMLLPMVDCHTVSYTTIFDGTGQKLTL